MRWFQVIGVLLLVGAAIGSQVDESTLENENDVEPRRRVMTRPLKYGLLLANPDDVQEEDGRRLSNNGGSPEDNFQPPVQDDGVDELPPIVGDEDESEYAAQRRNRKPRRKEEPEKRRPSPPRRSRAQRDEESYDRRRGDIYKSPVDLDVNEADGDLLPPLDNNVADDKPAKADGMMVWSSRMGPLGAAGAGIAVVFGLGACCMRGRKKRVLPLTTHDAFGGRHMAKRA